MGFKRTTCKAEEDFTALTNVDFEIEISVLPALGIEILASTYGGGGSLPYPKFVSEQFVFLSSVTDFLLVSRNQAIGLGLD